MKEEIEHILSEHLISEQPDQLHDLFTKQLQSEREKANEICQAIQDCEQERLSGQLSGMDTGWEHPNTQTMFKRVLFLANQQLKTSKED